LAGAGGAFLGGAPGLALFASGARCGREGFPPLSGTVGAIWEDVAAAAAAAGREQLAGEKLEMICQSLVPAESWGPKLCRRPGLA
jgi:hypothetical protein